MPKLVADNSGFGDLHRKLIKNTKGKAIDCRENVYLILIEHPVWKDRIAYDEFANRIVIRVAPDISGFTAGDWKGDHDLLLGLWLAQVMGIVVRNEKTLGLGVSMAANTIKFHPVREYLEALVWDGVRRCDDWLADFLGAEKSPYTMAVGRYFLLNMVARVFEPGCIMRSVPVIEGAQERGKSTALRTLAEPWFSDTHLDIGSKDVYQQIQGVWLYEIGEMHSFSKAEVSRVKEFVSSRQDNFRPPYERRIIRVPRQVGFSGTVNEGLYLRDWTGNTRYWPIAAEKVEPINVQGLADARDQLFAEAVIAYRAGERRYPTREQHEELFAPQQEQREIQHPWQPLIEAYIASYSGERVFPGDILFEALKFEPSKLQDSHAAIVGRIMHRVGWERKREGGGARRWYYERPPKQILPPPAADEVPF